MADAYLAILADRGIDYFFGNAFNGEQLSFTELGNVLKGYLGPVFGRDYEPPSYNRINTTWTPVIRDCLIFSNAWHATC